MFYLKVLCNSVHAHVLSPLGKDENLFNGAISFSGTMLFGSDIILEAEVKENNNMFMDDLEEKHQIDSDNFWSCAQKKHCLEKIMGLANLAGTKSMGKKQKLDILVTQISSQWKKTLKTLQYTCSGHQLTQCQKLHCFQTIQLKFFTTKNKRWFLI